MLDDDQLVTVADVQGDHDTLRAAVEADGWPDVDDLRGRFVFVLDDHERQARPVPRRSTPTRATG